MKKELPDGSELLKMIPENLKTQDIGTPAMDGRIAIIADELRNLKDGLHNLTETQITIKEKITAQLKDFWERVGSNRLENWYVNIKDLYDAFKQVVSFAK